MYRARYDDDIDAWCVKREGSDAIYRNCGNDKLLAGLIAEAMNRHAALRKS
jgi:hypothetical protein